MTYLSLEPHTNVQESEKERERKREREPETERGRERVRKKKYSSTRYHPLLHNLQLLLIVYFLLFLLYVHVVSEDGEETKRKEKSYHTKR